MAVALSSLGLSCYVRLSSLGGYVATSAAPEKVDYATDVAIGVLPYVQSLISFLYKSYTHTGGFLDPTASLDCAVLCQTSFKDVISSGVT